jgi:hypothetical protein
MPRLKMRKWGKIEGEKLRRWEGVSKWEVGLRKSEKKKVRRVKIRGEKLRRWG